MKKLLPILMALALLSGCSMLSKKPVEKLVPKSDVELTGNGFQIFRLGSDLKLVMVQSPDNTADWMIRATVPLMNVSENPIGPVDINVNLLDESGMKVRDGFVLVAEDMIDLIPKYNAEKNVEKNIVFSASEDSRKYFTYKEAADMIARTKSIAMNVNQLKTEAEVIAEQKAEQKKKEPLTLNSLLEKHGVYGLLSQYDKLLRNKEKKKAKEVEDRLYAICKQVKADPSIPKDLASRFRDYIENKEDEIEDKY